MDLGFASAPVVSAGGPYSVAEGSQVTLHATATNAAGLPMTYTWNLGGSVTATGASAIYSAVDGPATKTATVTVCTSTGVCTSANATIAIANVPPKPTIAAPTYGSVFRVGTHVALSGSFTDPGVLDTHTATWRVDGTTLKGTVAEKNGSGTAGRHLDARRRQASMRCRSR